MLRWLLRLVGLGLLGVGILLWVVIPGVSSDTPVAEETTISSYIATFEVSDDGRLSVVETLTVNFPFPGKHGIFRFFDVRDENDPGARRQPHDLYVSRDGAAEPAELLSEGGGRYRVWKIGSADVTLAPGDHTYVLRYRIDDVLLPVGGDPALSEFYWNLVPGGWRQPIEDARLTVTLPAATSDVRCAVGQGAVSGCRLRGEGTTTLRVRAGPLPPRTPVTLQTTVATPPSSGSAVPWPQRFDPVLGTRLFLLVLVLVAAVGSGVAGWLLSRRTHEQKPAFPLQYAPPVGVGPAQGRYIFTERLGKESFVASVMQAAEHGAVVLDRESDGWRITDRNGPRGWDGLDQVTHRLAGLLSGPGTSFQAGRKDVAAGKRLQSEKAALEAGTRQWARHEGLMTSTGGFGVLAVLGGLVLTVAVLVLNPLNLAVLALIPGLFTLGAVELAFPGSATRRTTAGRDLWSRVGGFHRVLSTPSSMQRFEFSGREELYTAYLPWAVALGCAEAWAAKYRDEMGAEPPMPGYIGGYVGAPGGYVDHLVDDFSATVSSAISAYEATQSSSGGGGFSGGGGGGGGGGGSW